MGLDRVIALAGNPNVGKSTVFNALTGLKQHTGNWSGKTVVNAQGVCHHIGRRYVFVDLPGCYSLMPHSAEEEVSRDFICFEKPDAVVVVCDATCLERNLNLVIQTLEITPNVIVCINMMDEAKKKNIQVHIQDLSKLLGVPVVPITARSSKGLDALMDEVSLIQGKPVSAFKVVYPEYIEDAIANLTEAIEKSASEAMEKFASEAMEKSASEAMEKSAPEAIEKFASEAMEKSASEAIEKSASEAIEESAPNARWLALRLLENDEMLISSIKNNGHIDFYKNERLADLIESIKNSWIAENITEEKVRDDIVQTIVKTAESIAHKTVVYKDKYYDRKDRKLDKILTSKWAGFPAMFIILMLTFWITITGANYPSQLLGVGLFWVEDRLINLFTWLHAPEFLTGMLVLGAYRVLAWVVSVMLPPMAIFFPLFTLLEDSGYLPRVAFNLDKVYKKCCACGKQALTMCMGFGCNAAGVIGCRIIDSPRERLIAIITNNFVPCNGRFPTLIAIISMFFIGVSPGIGISHGFGKSALSALFLTCVIVFGVIMTFVVSKLLSMTILKGMPSSFTLELPPYRRPQIGKVILRSIFDRTLFVLGRAVVVAAPAGIVIWLLANITLGDTTLLIHISGLLDPFARQFGMDGVILLAFILGLPANEIVIPIMIMIYMSQGSLMEIDNLSVLKELFVDNGWTWVTATCVMLFSLMHWPCSTTCLTIRKESGSLKWTAVAFIVPTIIGLLVCFVFSNLADLLIAIG